MSGQGRISLGRTVNDRRKGRSRRRQEGTGRDWEVEYLYEEASRGNFNCMVTAMECTKWCHVKSLAPVEEAPITSGYQLSPSAAILNNNLYMTIRHLSKMAQPSGKVLEGIFGEANSSPKVMPLFEFEYISLTNPSFYNSCQQAAQSVLGPGPSRSAP